MQFMFVMIIFSMLIPFIFSPSSLYIYIYMQTHLPIKVTVKNRWCVDGGIPPAEPLSELSALLSIVCFGSDRWIKLLLSLLGLNVIGSLFCD